MEMQLSNLTHDAQLVGIKDWDQAEASIREA